MSDPHATFSIFAEVSVALAGFSGIVITFGRRTVSDLSQLELRRLTNLFILSGLALFVSLLGVSLLHLESLAEESLWRVGSAVLFLLAAPWLVWDVLRVRRLEKQERVQVNPVILITFNLAAVAMVILQLVNWLHLAEAWPLFLALVLTVIGAFQQFILLVRMEYRD